MNKKTGRIVGALLASIALVDHGTQHSASAQDRRDLGPEIIHERVFEFNIGPQALVTALTSYTRVTGVQLAYNIKMTKGLKTGGLKGSYNRAQAIEKLIEGQGLVHRFTDAMSVTIEADIANVRAQSAELPQIVVAGQNDEKSYVATNAAVGMKTNTPLIETPASVSVVTRAQIVDQKAQNVQEALRYVPGVRTEATGALTETDSSIQIRGFDQGSSNLFVDGMRMSSTSYLGSYTPELYGIERVEVLRGPASILYGQNSPGGIINLVTKRPTETAFGEIEVQGGSFQRKQAAIDLGGPIDPAKQFSYRFTALGSDGKTQIDHIDDRKAFVSGAVTWRPTHTTQMTVIADHQRRDTAFAVGYPARGTVLNNPNGWIQTNRFIGEPGFDDFNITKSSVTFLSEHQFNSVWTFRQNVRASRFETDSRSIVQAGFQAGDQVVNRRALTRQTNADTITTDTQAQAKFGFGPVEHTVLAGFDHQSADIHRIDGNAAITSLNIYNPIYGMPFNIPAFTSGTDQISTNNGLYIQDQIKFDKRWVLLLGGRHDQASSKTTNLFTGAKTSKDDAAFSKRAGFVYLGDFGLAPYVSYAESFEPQTGTDRFNQPFKPTEGQQKEAGIKFQPEGYNSFVTFSAFDLVRQNVTTPDPVNQNFSVQTGEIQVRGVELEAKLNLNESFDLIATATSQQAKITKSNGADLGKVPTRVPDRMASIWATYRIPSGYLTGLKFGGGVRYIGETWGDQLNTFQVPAFTLVDALVSYDFGQFRLALNAINLFDKVYVTGCNSLTNCGYGVRRTITASLKYRW